MLYRIIIIASTGILVCIKYTYKLLSFLHMVCNLLVKISLVKLTVWQISHMHQPRLLILYYSSIIIICCSTQILTYVTNTLCLKCVEITCSCTVKKLQSDIATTHVYMEYKAFFTAELVTYVGIGSYVYNYILVDRPAPS